MHTQMVSEHAIETALSDWRASVQRRDAKPRPSSQETIKYYICSPCRGNCAQELEQNMLAARFYCWHSAALLHGTARAPHALLPQILNDAVPAERALALRFGLELLELSDCVCICGNRITNGMRGEIEYAAKLRMPILVFHDDLIVETQKLVTRAGGSKHQVSGYDKETLLYLSPEELFNEKGANHALLL